MEFENLNQSETSKIEAALKKISIDVAFTDIIIVGAEMPQRYTGMTLGDSAFAVNKAIIDNEEELIKTFKHEFKHLLDRRIIGSVNAHGESLEKAAKETEVSDDDFREIQKEYENQS